MICLLSSHNFLNGFRQFLTELYRQSLSPGTIPLERIICNFMTGQRPRPRPRPPPLVM
jgi:hypothetical protein